MRPAFYLSFFLLLPAAGSAYELYRTESDVPLRWFSPAVTITWADSTPEGISANDFRTAIETSYALWSQLSCDGEATPFDFDIEEAGPQQVGFREDGPNTNALVVVSEGWSHGSGAVAITSITYDRTTGEIVDADLELNGQHYDYSIDPLGSEVDLSSAVAHEVGHLLGLDHSEVPTAVMAPGPELGQIRRTLDPDDIAGFCAQYGPDAPPLPEPPVDEELSGSEVATGAEQPAVDPGAETINGAETVAGRPGGGGCSLASSPSSGAWLFCLFALLVLRRRTAGLCRR